jgi:hypothetical protein
MADADAGCAFPSGDAAQKRVAGATPGVLEGEMTGTGNLPDIAPLGEVTDMEGPGQITHPDGILRSRLVAESVVEMGDDELLGSEELVPRILQVQQKAEEAE